MQILIAREKHGDQYFDASTPEALGNASMHILKTRFEEGWWYHRHSPQLTDRDLSTKNPTETSAEYFDRIDAYNEKQVAQSKAANRWYDEAEALVKGKTTDDLVGNGKRFYPRSWLLLRERSDYEYEEVELISVQQF